VEQYSGMWVVNQRNLIDDYLRDSGNLVPFNVILDKFLTTIAVQKPTTATAIREPSTILHTQASNSNSAPPKCLYGFNHKYVDYYYLNESKRPAK